jgi:hypothetical protein
VTMKRKKSWAQARASNKFIDLKLKDLYCNLVREGLNHKKRKNCTLLQVMLIELKKGKTRVNAKYTKSKSEIESVNWLQCAASERDVSRCRR